MITIDRNAHPANRYAVLYRVHQAKGPQKRAAKIAEIVARLASGEAFHPRRMRRL